MIKDKLKFTAEMEGLKLKMYRCPAGKLTIGYGHNLEDNGISTSVAEQMLSEDISECDRILRTKYKKIANKANYIVEVCRDMLFNLGEKRFSKFKNFLKAIEDEDENSILAEMVDSTWFKQVGRRSKLLWLSVYLNTIPIEVLEECKERAKGTCLSENYVINNNFYKYFIEWYETKCNPIFLERPRIKDIYNLARKEY